MCRDGDADVGSLATIQAEPLRDGNVMAEARPTDPSTSSPPWRPAIQGPPLNAFYAQYASTVLALLMKMLGSRAEAEEILQEVFVELWRRAPQYDSSRGSVVAWVVTVARSRALDALRARTRRHGNGQMQFFSEKHGLRTESGRPDVLVSSTRWHQALRQAFKRSERRPARRARALVLSRHVAWSDRRGAQSSGRDREVANPRGHAGLRTMLPIIQRSMVA